MLLSRRPSIPSPATLLPGCEIQVIGQSTTVVKDRMDILSSTVDSHDRKVTALGQEIEMLTSLLEDAK